MPNTASAEKKENPLVYIKIMGEIEPGMANFLERSLERADHAEAKKVVLEIDTPGGLIASAQKMKTAIMASKVPVTAYITGEAKSAGVLISLAAEKVYMVPGASIGAAEPIPNNPKILASWRSDLESVAEARGRDPRIVAGMADQSMVIENVKNAGELLSLTAQKAVELKIADKIISSRDLLLADLAQADGVYYETVEYQPGWGEKLSWWLINPFISPILLLLGCIGLIIEVFTPGWGLGGVTSFVAFALYFGGHIMAGVAGWLSIFIFIVGIIAILLEIFVIPGFGGAGLIGAALMVWSVFITSTNPTQAVVSIIVAVIGSVVVFYYFVKILNRRGAWEKLILGTKLDSATGYVASKSELKNYMGMEGRTLTPLRPAGTADLGGSRIDVVSEGDFIAAGTLVQVVLVEGGRVVVRAVQ